MARYAKGQFLTGDYFPATYVGGRAAPPPPPAPAPAPPASPAPPVRYGAPPRPTLQELADKLDASRAAYSRQLDEAQRKLDQIAQAMRRARQGA